MIFTKPFSLLFISIVFFFALGCYYRIPLNNNSLLSCSVELNGKSYDIAINPATQIGTLTLPYGSDLATLKVKTITVSDKAKASLTPGSSISPSNNAFTITVIAENGIFNNYTITIVSAAPSTEGKLLTFKFEKAKNPQLPNDVTIHVTDIGTKLIQADVNYISQDSFVPSFTVSFGAKVYVNTVEQTSGTTPQGFLNTVEYKVVSQSGNTQTYKITINYTSNDFTVTSDGAISGNNPSLTTALIGKYMNGIRVTEIANSGFKDYTNLTSLKLPTSLKKIGVSAFQGCSGFKGELTLPSSLTSIGDGAFYECSGFTGTLTLPSSLISIGSYAFYECSGFTGNLTLPSSLTSIGNGAFHECSGFKGSLTLPNSLTSIKDGAFNGCSGFTGSLTLPSSLTSIEKAAFNGCSGFTESLTLPSSLTSIGSYAFNGCSGFTGSLTLPNSLTSIGEAAFASCNGFDEKLIIPSTVYLIGAYAFLNCTNFTARCNKSNATLGANAFQGVTTKTTGCP